MPRPVGAGRTTRSILSEDECARTSVRGTPGDPRDIVAGIYSSGRVERFCALRVASWEQSSYVTTQSLAYCRPARAASSSLSPLSAISTVGRSLAHSRMAS